MVSPFKPTGDQPQAIARKSKISIKASNIKRCSAQREPGNFTMANVIAQVNKPTIVIVHNKTLAGQLYAELKAFFPHNRVEYFISYYDYYQPEAYVPSKDLYIEKDSSINDEIDEMRHAATASILERRDTIIVASVSCIYGIGDPEEYKGSMLTLRKNQKISRDDLCDKLIQRQFVRNNIEFARGTFRVKGDNVDILPTYERNEAIRITFFDDDIEKIALFDVTTGKIRTTLDVISIFPATHFVMNEQKKEEALRRIEEELKERVAYFKANYQCWKRIEQRTKYDLEMLREIGLQRIENYSATCL